MVKDDVDFNNQVLVILMTWKSKTVTEPVTSIHPATRTGQVSFTVVNLANQIEKSPDQLDVLENNSDGLPPSCAEAK